MTHSQFSFLQRAEKSKQRRQTFNGFAVKDYSTDLSADAQNRSSTPLSEEVFSPDARKSSPLSHHKKRLCKSVTFKDTVDTNRQVCFEKGCNENEQSSRCKEKCRRRSAPTGGETEPEADVKALQGYTESNCHNFIAADKNWVNSFSDSPLLSEKEKIPDIDAVRAEHKDCSRTEDGQECTVNNAGIVGCCGLTTDIPIMTSYQEHSDSSKQVIAAEEMGNPGIDTTFMEDIHFPGHKSEGNLGKEGLVPLQSKVSVKAKVSFEKEDAHRCSSAQESDNVSPQNWHWLRLFEEEFPRRSPRLQSTPNFGNQTVVSQDNSQPRKTKRARSKHSRTKKENPSCSKDKITTMSETSSCTNSTEEITTQDFVFPRPSSEQTNNGGFLNAIVDFSLPDNEFAKLKLAKIKGALPVGRIDRVSNDKSEKATNEHDTLAESKCEEEMKEDCSHLLTKPANFVLACSMQVEANSAENRSEGNGTNKSQALSTSINFECNQQSESSVNNLMLSSEHQQHHLLLQKEPVKSCNVSSKVQPLENMAKQTDYLPKTDVEPGHNSSSCVETCFVTAVADNVPHNITIETKNKLSTGDYEQHDLYTEQGKLDYKSASDNNERLLVQCDSRRPQEINKFSNERDSNFDCLKTNDMFKTCGTEFPLEADIGIKYTAEQIYDQRELFDLTEKRSSPSSHEPRIGDQATPHGKMKEPQETSQLSCMTSPEDQFELSPLLMMACLQVCLVYYSSQDFFMPPLYSFPTQIMQW